jgi:two-component system, NarL family, nitrate/nitrite response regulator NarL
MAIRVVIYDDNKDRRESLKYLVQMYDDMLCVGVFNDCNRVLEDMQEVFPDVVLMDIEMPGVNGIEGVRKIKTTFPTIPVLMQTVFEDDDNLFESIKAGASGYLLKKTDPERIIDAIREVVAGGAPMTPSMAMKVLRYFQHKSPEENAYSLTERERTILALLVDGLSYKMIAERESISFHTVNSHVRKIYEKLHVHSLGEAVSKALRENLL